MNIVKPLQLGVLHKSFTYLEKDIFAVSIPIAFSLLDGEILLEQTLWENVGEQIGSDIFDGAMPKEVGEVLVAGSFMAPNNQKVEAGSVTLNVSATTSQGIEKPLVHKELAIFGNRHWHKLLGAGITPSSPEPFTELPISYQHAYGGEGFELNPEGIGFKPVETEFGERHFLPNIEYKNQILTSSSTKPAPASLGRLDIMWHQRLSKAGTYDQKYIEEKMPGLPDDINWLYFNDAAEDQWLSGMFTGNETYSITNMHPEHPVLSGSLPAIYGRAFVNQKKPKVNDNNELTGEFNTEFKEIPTKLDTLWLFPNCTMGVMIFRGTVAAYTDTGQDIQDLLLACENRNDTPRTLAHYQDQLTKRTDPDHGYKYALFSAPLIAEGMRCGFKQIQDEFDFPLEMLSKSNLDSYVDEKRKEAEAELLTAKDNIIEQCKLAGVDPTEYLKKIDSPDKSKEQLDIEALFEKIAPGMITDPNNIDIFNIDLSVLDELKEYTDKIVEEKKQQAKDKIKEDVIKLKEENTSGLFDDIIDSIEEKAREIDLPPMWPRSDFSEQYNDIQQQVVTAQEQISELKKQGVKEEDLPKVDIDLEAIQSQLIDADKNLKQTYLLGAHLVGESRSPHPGKEPELKQILLTKYANNESLNDLDFACIDVQGENLTNIDLSGCYLEGVNFSGCDLSGANLSGAILAGANLTDANLTNSNCQGANLGAADLTNANFTNVNLDKAQLGGSTFNGTHLINCQMSEINFLDTKFETTVFNNSNLSQCNFINPVFNDCEFIGSDLSTANIVKGKFSGANFQQAVLDGANFVECSLNYADFTGAQMINVRFVGGCELNHAKFNDANISRSCLRENQINHASFNQSILDEADLSGALMENSDFTGAKAYRTQFMQSHMKNALLTNVNLMEGSLYKAYLVGAKFDNANLYCVNFMDCTLGDNSYRHANLDQTVLKDWRP